MKLRFCQNFKNLNYVLSNFAKPEFLNFKIKKSKKLKPRIFRQRILKIRIMKVELNFKLKKTHFFSHICSLLLEKRLLSTRFENILLEVTHGTELIIQ